MIRILMVATEKEPMGTIGEMIASRGDYTLVYADSAERALGLAEETAYELVIADERIGEKSALVFAEDLTRVNPMINCAVVSGLGHEEFHEASEGLGVLYQLKPVPEAKEVGELLTRLSAVLGMTARTDEA